MSFLIRPSFSLSSLAPCRLECGIMSVWTHTTYKSILLRFALLCMLASARVFVGGWRRPRCLHSTAMPYPCTTILHEYLHRALIFWDPLSVPLAPAKSPKTCSPLRVQRCSWNATILVSFFYCLLCSRQIPVTCMFCKTAQAFAFTGAGKEIQTNEAT